MNTYEQELAQSEALVLREAQASYEGRGRLQETLERLAKRLYEMEIECSLVGGYALIRHGVRRFTEDIDVLVRENDLAKLREKLVGMGYVGVSGRKRSIRDAETGVRIDFVISGEFPGDGMHKPVAFPDPLPRGAGVSIPVVDLSTLIELKLASGMTASGRLQDLADVQHLISTHALRQEFAEKLHPYVRAQFLELLARTSKTSGNPDR